MKPDRIKKGLQCCTSSEYDCNDCPLIEKKQVEGGCGHFLMKNASDYINQLEAEVEKLEKENSQLRNEVEYLLTNRLLGEDKTTVMAMCCETLEKIRQDMQIVEIKRTIQDLKIAMESDRDFDDIMNGTRRGDEE